MLGEFDHVDFEFLSIILHEWFRSKRQQWQKLDRLYSEHAYEEQEFSRLLHKEGKLTGRELQQAWDDLDNRMGEYDWRCLDRRELEKYLRDLERRLRANAREMQKAVSNAA